MDGTRPWRLGDSSEAHLRDLVLSSGFLAFAAQCGFLQAVEESGIAVDGVCGTSSGALAGALWASGWPAQVSESAGRWVAVAVAIAVGVGSGSFEQAARTMATVAKQRTAGSSENERPIGP